MNPLDNEEGIVYINEDYLNIKKILDESDNDYIIVLPQFKKNKKNILVTHTDLDGIGCEILFRTITGIENKKVYNVNYNNVDDTINEILNKIDKDYCNNNITLTITDISINEETAKRLNRYVKENKLNVILFDHHKTALWLNNKYSWANVNLDFCGTKLYYDYLIT